jgi:hypothetical protein
MVAAGLGRRSVVATDASRPEAGGAARAPDSLSHLWMANVPSPPAGDISAVGP